MASLALRIIVIVALVVCSMSITSYEFKRIRQTCKNEKAISLQCGYDIFENNVDNTTCAKDMYKSYICETSFSNCMDLADDQ